MKIKNLKFLFNFEDESFKKLIIDVLQKIPGQGLVPDILIFNTCDYSFTNSDAGNDGANTVWFDLRKLKKEPKKYQMKVIAHELAHLFLGHTPSNDMETHIEQDKEAKSLVKKWRF